MSNSKHTPAGVVLVFLISAIGTTAAAQWDEPPPPAPPPPPPGEEEPVPPPPADEDAYPDSYYEPAPAAPAESGVTWETGAAPAQPVPPPWPEEPPPQPAAEAAPEEEAAEEETSSVTGEFLFGSYGRAQITFDTDGNRGLNQNVTAHGPRLFEPSYAEIDLAYRLEKDDGFDALVLFTLALFEPLAHYSGFQSDQFWAVRNLMAEVGGFIPGLEGLRLWVGSRMYRGDDIYLLDFWPLDNLNTIGGGAMFTHEGFNLRLHVGVNRLDNDYHYQSMQVPGAQVGAREKVLLDRQRLIGSARIGYTFTGVVDDFGLKILAYGEAHRLPEGKRIPSQLMNGDNAAYPPEEVIETLPEDRGFVVGGQLGMFGFGPSSHLNLFIRYANGIAAYGEFGVPYGRANDGTADGAYEVLGGVSGNWESKWVGLMLGGYLRRFVDADRQRFDTDDFAEGTLVARPVIFATDHFHQAFEVSYQQHRPYGLDPQTNKQEIATVTQLTIMEIISLDRGNYQRPQIRLYYTLGIPNGSARDMYEPGDTRRLARPEHFFGLGAEWWFNSSSYE